VFAVKVRAVTVDFWGTLVVDPPTADERYEGRRLAAFAAILRDHGLEYSAAQLSRAYERSGEFIRRVWSSGSDVPVVRPVTEILATLDATLPRRASPELLAALLDAYARPILLVPPTVASGARGALAHLREGGIALAIVSNTMRTPGTTLRQLLAQFELLDCFDAFAFSDEVGVRKPRPEIFEAALRGVGAEPATTVHVGDDPALDVRGARRAGLRVIQLVANASRAARPGERPDATITRLDELPAAIAALEAE
jgi:HAD superfamily hydrolase (TIGR01509 family)